MKLRYLFAHSLILFSLTSFAQNRSESVLKILRGSWTLTSIYKTSNVQGPSEAEQRKLLNTRLTYNLQRLESCGQSVAITSVQEHRVSASDFLQNTHARFNEVKVSAAEIPEVVINERRSGNCLGAFPLPGQDIYVKTKDELLVYFEGVFYQALRVK